MPRVKDFIVSFSTVQTLKIGPHDTFPVYELQEYELKKDRDSEQRTKKDRCEVRSFYKERVDAVRESNSPFCEVNKEIYKVTNLGI